MNKYDVLAWFAPNKCLICGKYIKANESVCTNCIPEKTMIRVFYLTVKGQSKFFHCESLYAYRERYRDCMRRFKFHGKGSYARKFINFADLMLNKEELSNYDAVCYVPTRKSKRKGRRYNQSKKLAVQFSKITGIKLVDAITKNKENKIQHQLLAKQREENVKGVYSCSADVKGQNILIIDDIITTGATMCQCALVLLNAGANSVKGICMADRRTEFIKGELK